MSVEIKVPALGESVTEATIAKWYKKEGDEIARDEILLELETEKVTLEVNAPASGVIASLAKKVGDTVEVGQVLGMIKEGAVSAKSASAPAESSPTKTSPAEMLPPSAARIVAENALDPNNIKGTGKDGRITKIDAVNASSCAPNVSIAQNNGPREERIKMSRLRKTIAERLKASQNTAAILTTFNEIDMSHIIAVRQKYKDHFEKKHGVKLGFMSFFIKAAVAALKELPSVNAMIEGDDLVYRNYYDIGVAVGTEQGLVVPVLRDVDGKSFSGIEKEIAAFGKKAREGKISMAELSGGTFTISNGGVYGSLLSTPIINPPQSGILGMHKTQERAVVIDGKIEIRPMMYVALSYDHRIIDGKEAVTFLVRIKEYVEDPERLLLEV
ncbi:MAG UNVERIFIED_CONTAM: 2-oxoglutarate dehydrogenase complex dihydrolipoyllysine-residue succinyltransferase [Rickettsiaceae bacterium]|jgi:2-oxoglutarate dehydrogenase E2 component (dihydrolipoamide succinyltransferase)